MSSTPATDTSCPTEDEVLAYVQGDLSVDRCRRVESHIHGCSLCRGLVVALSDEKSSSPGLLAEGAVIAGRYRLKEELGRGASATVFRATDEKLGIDVALKTFVLPSAEHRTLARRELLVARKISHPNVCRVHDVIDEGDFLCLSMELVVGETLATRIEAYGSEPLEHDLVKEWLDAILEGLGAAHEKGVIHRDVKPTNVIVERQTGRVVLMDFGLARDLDALESRQRLLGTPAYWAPEQARGEEATKASDVYAVGVLGYRMLTGKSFRVSDKNALSNVPKRYREVIARALAPSPSDRYADASEFRAALRRTSRPPRSTYVVVAVLVVALAVSAFALRPGARRPAAPELGPGASAAPPAVPTMPASVVVAPAVAPSAPASVPVVATSSARQRPHAPPSPSAAPPRPSGSTSPELLYGR